MRPPPSTSARPMDRASLESSAMGYVERFQTTQARLIRHLAEKIRRRGWEGDDPPDLEALAARMVELGYIDDAAFAQARARGMERKGLGARRLSQDLASYGISKEISESVVETLDPWAAALVFARRRRLGPFGPESQDPKKRERQFAAMLRAGHEPRLSRAILTAATSEEAEALAEERGD